MRRILPALVAGVLAAPAPAAAGTLTVEPDRATFTGAPGERNDLSATRDYDRVYLRDEAAPIQLAGSAAGRCTVTDAKAVNCASVLFLAIQTGDGADRFRGEALGADLGAGDDVGVLVRPASDSTLSGGAGDDDLTGASLNGGDGADRLTLDGEGYPGAYGEAGDDTITGTPGPNYITPGPGRDVVRAGDGDDQIFEDESVAADDFDGEAGRDIVTYMYRPTAVAIDLVLGRGGAGGDEDRLAGFESATGGQGDDVVRGGPANDSLGGFSGNDVLVGGGGDDELRADLGDDRLDGGEGADVLSAGPGEDVADGGPGDDQLAGDEGDDALFGADGADVVVGGKGVDVLRGGAGDDRLEAWPDRFHDSVECGEGARDEAWVEPGVDRLDASCERVIRRPVASLLAAHLETFGRRLRRSGRETRVFLVCSEPGTTTAVEVRRLGRVIGRRRVTCPEPDINAYHAVGLPARVAIRLPRGMARSRRALRVVVVVAPGDGSVATREAAILR